MFAFKRKEILGFSGVTKKVMIKTKNKFSISFGGKLKLIYNELKTVQ